MLSIKFCSKLSCWQGNFLLVSTKVLKVYGQSGKWRDPMRWMEISVSPAYPNRMNFRKSSKQPLTLPPSFSESYIAIFATKLLKKVHMFTWRDCCVLYDPISHEMHEVQMFNIVIGRKHTLKKPFCIIFMKKALFKGPNFAI